VTALFGAVHKVRHARGEGVREVVTASFLHYGDLYSAPCTAKEKSFEVRVKCVRKNPGEQSLRQRKPIPHRGANHR